MNKHDRIKELVKLLNYYRDEYYNNQNSEISDFEYDQLFDELSTLEQETGFIMATSPTQTVGYEVKSELVKVKHNHPMLSLDKTKNVDDVIKFLNGKDGIIMAKMDGLTCSLRYINGELVSAETRGDGETGEDILHCAKTIKNLPLKIKYLNEVVIDGEVIITYDDFDKINATLPENQKYKHPRNLASGSIRQLDGNVAAQRNMKFVAWKFVKGCDYKAFFTRNIEMLDLGFDIAPMLFIPSKHQQNSCIEECISKIRDAAEKESFPIDGCVFGYNDVAYGESLGATGHHLRSQLAYKFYDELYETNLQYIDWTLGKTGVLTPTAVFNPVDIDGTEITRASLHNISIIKSLGLTNNCTVRIYKANQIIPQIDSCKNDGSGEIAIPAECPVCGGKTAVKRDNESEVLMCSNPNCSGKKIAQFAHFVSRKCMSIDGLSEATLEKFISLGYINDFKDIYHLSDRAEELVKLDGFGPKSVQKLLLAIEKSRDVKLENFIAALGIPNIGLSAAKAISNHFNGNYEDFVNAYFYWHFDWTILDDFGRVMADSLNGYLHDNLEDVNELAAEMRFVVEEKSTDNSLNNLKFCITGSFSQSRDELKKRLEAKGAKFVSSVSKNLNVLFAGEKAGSKIAKAQSLGIRIAYEDELMKLLEN